MEDHIEEAFLGGKNYERGDEIMMSVGAGSQGVVVSVCVSWV